MKKQDEDKASEEKAEKMPQETDKKQPEEKKKDCRDNCMHCGAHCIYLEK